MRRREQNPHEPRHGLTDLELFGTVVILAMIALWLVFFLLAVTSNY